MVVSWHIVEPLSPTVPGIVELLSPTVPGIVELLSSTVPGIVELLSSTVPAIVEQLSPTVPNWQLCDEDIPGCFIVRCSEVHPSTINHQPSTINHQPSTCFIRNRDRIRYQVPNPPICENTDRCCFVLGRISRKNTKNSFHGTLLAARVLPHIFCVFAGSERFYERPAIHSR